MTDTTEPTEPRPDGGRDGGRTGGAVTASSAPLERHPDLDRLLVFVDAIVAIAITLLVLPLAELAPEGVDGSVAHLLDTHQGQIWSFLLSFAVIARLWFSQHHSLRFVISGSGLLSVLLMAWTATVVFLPFPTALLAEHGSQPATKVLYIGTLAANMTLWWLMGLAVRRRPESTGGRPLPDAVAGLVNVALLLTALVLALAIPGPSYWTLLLLALDQPVRTLGSRARALLRRPRR